MIHVRKRRGLPRECAGLEILVNLANLADPSVVAQVREADQRYESARIAIVDRKLKGTLDESAERDLFEECHDANALRDAELLKIWPVARALFPHPHGWDAVAVPLPDRPRESRAKEHFLAYAYPDVLLNAASAARAILCVIVEKAGEEPENQQSIQLPQSEATAPCLAITSGTMLAALDLIRDLVLPSINKRAAWRIGKCPIRGCEKLFVRKRHDQRGCSREHSHAIFMRDPKRREKYEQNRKKNRRAKKARVALRIRSRLTRERPEAKK